MSALDRIRSLSAGRPSPSSIARPYNGAGPEPPDDRHIAEAPLPDARLTQRWESDAEEPVESRDRQSSVTQPGAEKSMRDESTQSAETAQRTLRQTARHAAAEPIASEPLSSGSEMRDHPAFDNPQKAVFRPRRPETAHADDEAIVQRVMARLDRERQALPHTGGASAGDTERSPEPSRRAEPPGSQEIVRAQVRPDAPAHLPVADEGQKAAPSTGQSLTIGRIDIHASDPPPAPRAPRPQRQQNLRTQLRRAGIQRL